MAAVEFLIEFSVRAFNTCIGAGLGFFLGGRLHRMGRRLDVDVDRDNFLLAVTVVGAIAGLLWGKNAWGLFDKKSRAGW